jgi:hypothetical protein
LACRNERKAAGNGMPSRSIRVGLEEAVDAKVGAEGEAEAAVDVRDGPPLLLLALAIALPTSQERSKRASVTTRRNVQLNKGQWFFGKRRNNKTALSCVQILCV